MMKYRVPFVIATASIWLISCSRSPEQQVEVFEPEYHIKNHVYVDSIKSEDLIENFEYISLETRDDCLVGKVDDLQIVDDKLYIVSDDRVLVFDFDGKLIFKIDQIGRGPAEYQRIDNISIDDGTLFLYDNTQYGVLGFDASTGGYLFTKKLEYSVRQAIVRDGLVYSDRGGIGNPYISNDDRLLIGRFGEPEKIRSFFSQSKTVVQSNCYMDVYDGEMYWIDPLLNKVFKVDGDGVRSYLFYDFGTDNATADLPKDAPLSQLSKRNMKFNIANICETGDYVFSTMISGSEMVYMRFDKDQQVNYVYKNISKPFYQTLPIAETVYENRSYKVVPSWLVMFMKYNMAEKGFQLDADHRDYGIYKAVLERTDSDNPLIARFDLKR
ncbi:6-bladed beta-propeller [Parapedobacter sp. 10938]|uniref:6-bladed beta-propeller n=1 Tax=Parapedobacter flavus TaxID=3110225 RepID=UPI002DB9D750|nr:6-bladed beta-propeller [Parapedobacter sp. 10938]MEC3882086.1 6-bladed beta-propeller [Parapedobacter sp. 10938]